MTALFLGQCAPGGESQDQTIFIQSVSWSSLLEVVLYLQGCAVLNLDQSDQLPGGPVAIVCNEP